MVEWTNCSPTPSDPSVVSDKNLAPPVPLIMLSYLPGVSCLDNTFSSKLSVIPTSVFHPPQA
jgi:hypothetical protein